MLEPTHRSAAHDAAWLAIRQPAVIRLLERELAAPDQDAFAAGLALASRILAGQSPIADSRLDHRELAMGMQAVRSGRCDRAMVRSIRDQIDELPIALSNSEQDAVATVIAAVIYAVLDRAIAPAMEAADTLVA